MDYWRILLFVLIKVQIGFQIINANDVELVTQTIYGFLDFTTTIGNTVMIFSPQSSPPAPLPSPSSSSSSSSSSSPSATIITDLPATTTTTTITTATPLSSQLIKTKPSESLTNSISENTINPSKLETTITFLSDVALQTTTPNEKKLNTINSITPSISLFTNSDNFNRLTTSIQQEPQIEKSNVIVDVLQLSSSSSSAAASSSSSSSIVNNTPAVDNYVVTPKYNLLSRQLPQFIEESYRIGTLKRSDKNSKTPVVVTPESISLTKSSLPTTLRTHKNKKHKVRPSSTLQVLKTASPALTPHAGKFTSSSPKSQLRTSTYTATGGRKSGGKKNSHRSTTSKNNSNNQESSTASGSRSSNTRSKPKRKHKNKNHHSTTSKAPKYGSSTAVVSSLETGELRNFRSKTVQNSNVDLEKNNSHITKLNRAPGRWQYKTTPKPRVTIRKSNTDTGPPAILPGLKTASLLPFSNENISQNFVISNQSDLESSGSQNGNIVNNIEASTDENDVEQKFFTETLNVEISTPANFKDTYYEIATIRKPFIFQAGILKKTRYITVTSTLEKYLNTEAVYEPRNESEPLTENILTLTSSKFDDLIGSTGTMPVTLSPIFIANEFETPALDTATESFTLVTKKLKTQILPIIADGKENFTIYHTLLQTVDLTSLITVTKTFPHQNEMQTAKEFNDFKDIIDNLDEAGSEINIDLEFGDEGNHEIIDGKKEKKPNDLIISIQANQSIVGRKSTPNVIESFSPTLLVPSLPTANVITNSKPEIKLETVWESYVIPITNGQSTSFRTLSKSVGVVEKTSYTFETTTLPINTIVPPSTLNPFLFPLQQPQLQPHQFQTITSPFVQQTVVTQTESKVLKLTFGAKTAYTTLFSTQVVPTLQTIYVTTSIPVQNSANPFPGFFPQPYNPYAYLG